MFNVSGLNPEVEMTTNLPGYMHKYLTHLGDEGNPVSFERIQPKDYTLSLNGHIVHWAKPVAFVVTLAVLAGSTDDMFLRKLLLEETPKPGAGVPNTFGKAWAISPTILSLVYKAGTCESPNGGLALLNSLIPEVIDPSVDGGTFVNGFIFDGEFAPSISSDGKKQQKTYTLVFEEFTPMTFA